MPNELLPIQLVYVLTVYIAWLCLDLIKVNKQRREQDEDNARTVECSKRWRKQ